MPKRAAIKFVPAARPVREPVTKFGGQPVWRDAPQWPLSRETGRPMTFVCQVALDPELFGGGPGRMAYLFMTGDGDDFVDGTYEPDGGENAVVVQPGRKPAVPVVAEATGPTLCRMVRRPGEERLRPEPCEFAVKLTAGDDPGHVPQGKRWKWPDDRLREYHAGLDGNKVGGTPGFLQADEFPGRGFRRLLLQLDSTKVPFSVNFGDAGIGYAFLNADGTAGKFLWQCS